MNKTAADRARVSFHDARRTTDQPWRHWYWTARWRRIAQAQLRDHPLCAMCSTDERPVAATVCDHVVPHRGDEHLFWEGELQSLCKPCHDGTKQAQERRGYVTGVTLDGRPRDPRHPWNRPT
ncbi:HNH endonuclease [Methylobacterium nodulans]|nr:HNH endonuclease [Methylobacterium nodulans]